MWMLQWTGDQFLPSIKDASIVYRFVHRYVYASEVLRGKRVLDLGAGDGYGASILGRTAESVVGVVADDTIATQACDKHRKPNVSFVSAAHVPEVAQSFDAILFLGEAGTGEDRVVLEHKRLLKPDGVLILSVEAAENAEKLRRQLTEHFKHVQVLGQRVYANSSIWPMTPCNESPVREVVMARNSTDEFHAIAAEQRSPVCFIVIGSDAVTVPGNGSVFIDEGDELLKDQEKAMRELAESKATQATALKLNEERLAEWREDLASLREAFARHKSQILALTKTREYLESENSHLRTKIASSDEALAWRASQVEDLLKGIEAQNKANRDLLASRGWQFVLRFRAIRRKLMFWRG
jgi:protein-L-isoaspartate O-methyltransferase